MIWHTLLSIFDLITVLVASNNISELIARYNPGYRGNTYSNFAR